MKNLTTFLTFALITNLTWAQPPRMKSAEALSTSVDLKEQKFTGSLKSGFHFNEKAPNSLTADEQKQSLLKIEKQNITFSLPKTWATGVASLYVCDDANTFCETHSVEIKGIAPAAASKAVSSGGFKIDPTYGKVDDHGFILNDYPKALKVADKELQPLMIEFSAKWCPGCVRYEKEVFSNPQFRKLTHRFVKLKVDVDRFENFSLSEKYAIIGIPTIVVVNSREQEISRLVDFQTLEGLKKFVASIEKNPTSMKELMAQASPNSKNSLEIGLRLLASGQSAESLAYLEKVTPPPPELLQARVDAAKKAFDKDQKKDAYASILRDGLKKENQTTRSLGWRTELVGLLEPKSPEVQTLVSEGRALADRCLKDPKFLAEAVKTESLGEFMGYEKLWVAMLKADLVEASGAGEEAVAQAWKEAAQIGSAYKISPSKSGPALRYLIVLSSAKQFSEAEKFADQILKKDPENTDVKRRKLKILLGLKKPEEAAQLAQKILPLAEGRNEFWVAESLAKAYIASGKKEEAKKLIATYLSRSELQSEKMKSSKKSFEDLQKSLN